MTTQYVMRAYNTVSPVGYVRWAVLDNPDYTGTESGYNPSDLTGIVIEYQFDVPINSYGGFVTPGAAGGDLSGTYPNPVVGKSSASLFTTGDMQNDGYVQVTDNGEPVPLVNPYIFNAQIPSVVSINHQVSPTLPLGAFDSALRVDMNTDGGGQWDIGDSETGSTVVMLSHNAGNRGTHSAIGGYIHGLGVGDAIPFSFDIDAFGGYGPAEGASSVSAPESGCVGEFDLAQGGTRYTSVGGAVPIEEAGFNSCIFQAGISQAPSTGATVIHYSTIANQQTLGCRFILNKNHTTTGGVVTAITTNFDTLTTTLTFSGAPSWTSSQIGRYIKLASTDDLYPVTNNSQLYGDDVYLNGFGVGHWYLISAVPASNQLVVNGGLSANDFTEAFAQLPNTSYLIMDGGEIQSFTSSTITIQSNSYSWALNDVLYSPPHHFQALVGLNLIMSKVYKSGYYSTGGGEGIRIKNSSPEAIDFGIRFQGTFLDGYGGFDTAIKMDGLAGDYGIDMISSSFSEAGILLGQDARIVMSSSTNYPSMRGIGTDGIHVEGQAGYGSIYLTDNTNSTLWIHHPSAGRVAFSDEQLDTWLIQQTGQYVEIGPGLDDGYNGLRQDYFRTYTTAGRTHSLVPVASDYQMQQGIEIISVQTLSTPITITLPGVGQYTTGDTYIIKDAKGSASAHNITISGGVNNIDGSATLVMSTNYQAVRLLYDANAGAWMTI